MYEINLKFMFPFVAAMIGSMFSALFIVSFGITAAGIRMGGILGFLNINNSSFRAEWIAMQLFILIMIGDIIWTFLLTILLSTKSSWFDNWTSTKWSEYKQSSINNVEENTYKILDKRYSKEFESEEDQYYPEYKETLSKYTKTWIDYKNFSGQKKSMKKKCLYQDFLELSKNKKIIAKEHKDHLKLLIKQQKKVNKKPDKKYNK